jgi:hypothetical protein
MTYTISYVVLLNLTETKIKKINILDGWHPKRDLLTEGKKTQQN